MKIFITGPDDFWKFEFITDQIKFYTQNLEGWQLISPHRPLGAQTVARDYAEYNEVPIIYCSLERCIDLADGAIIFSKSGVDVYDKSQYQDKKFKTILIDNI